MTDLGLRPRSATELVDAAFQVFRRTPVQFIVASALVYVPWLVIELVFNLEITGETIPSVPALAANLVAGLAVYVILGGVMALLARDVYFERPPDVPAAFRGMVGRVFQLLATSLAMVGMMLSAAVVLIVGIIIGARVFGTPNPVVVAVMAGVATLIPTFYVFTRYFAARQAVMLENAGMRTALKRSSLLSAGLKGHVIATLLLGGLLTFAIMLGATLVAQLIPSHVIMRALITVVAVCVKPFFSIVETMLYYDTRIRKEAFDIEYLANSAGVLSPAPNAAI
jgi:hypothetical protein